MRLFSYSYLHPAQLLISTEETKQQVNDAWTLSNPDLFS